MRMNRRPIAVEEVGVTMQNRKNLAAEFHRIAVAALPDNYTAVAQAVACHQAENPTETYVLRSYRRIWHYVPEMLHNSGIRFPFEPRNSSSTADPDSLANRIWNI